MIQDPDEGICYYYVARICGQANVCKFLHCEQDVNYTGEILPDVLTQGTGGGRVVRYRHVCLQLPSGVGTPWPYFAQLP